MWKPYCSLFRVNNISVLRAVIVGVIIGVFALDVQASCDSIACTTKIIQIYPTGASDGRIYIRPDEASLSALDCTPAEGVFLTLHHSHANYTELFSVASLGFALDKRIRLRIVEKSKDCTISYMVIYK